MTSKCFYKYYWIVLFLSTIFFACNSEQGEYNSQWDFKFRLSRDGIIITGYKGKHDPQFNYF